MVVSDSGNLIRQLHRIQSIDFDYTINWTNINQFGHAARVDMLMLETPDINIQFEYFLADGYNEQLMGFIIDGQTQTLRDHIATKDRIGSNFFILTTSYGHDVANANLSINAHEKRVVGIGNSFLSQYAIMAEVGSIPRARISFEAFNVSSYTGVCNLPLPSVNPKKDCSHSDINFSIPDGDKGIWYEKVSGIEDISIVQGASALRPGDISVNLEDSAHLSSQVSGLSNSSSFDFHNNQNAAHIQGFAINVPFSNTKVYRMGRNLEFTRAPDFPVRIDVQVNALVANLKNGGLWDKICDKPVDLTFVLEDCRSVFACNNVVKHQADNMTISVRGAKLDVESFDSQVNDNKMVSLDFHAQIGSEDDVDNGLFISGKSFITEKPSILAWGKPLF